MGASTLPDSLKFRAAGFHGRHGGFTARATGLTACATVTGALGGAGGTGSSFAQRWSVACLDAARAGAGRRSQQEQADTGHGSGHGGPGPAGLPDPIGLLALRESAPNRAAASGCQVCGGSSAARRRSTHWSCLSLFSISLYVLLSERLLCAADQGTDGCRIQFERGCQFRIAESAAAEQQQLGLARIQRAEDDADMLLLFGGGADLLRIGRAGRRVRQPLMAVAAQAAAQLVQPGADRRTVQPSARLFALRPRSPPEFPKHFDGEFFGAAGSRVTRAMTRASGP